MLNGVFMPVVQAIYTNLNQAVDLNDMGTLTELFILRRCYYEFISCLISNSLAGELEDDERTWFSMPAAGSEDSQRESHTVTG